MKIKSGEYLFMEGTFDDHLYIVKKGLLTAQKLEYGVAQIKWTFEPGSLIGEGSLLENRPHTNSVKAEVDSEVIAISQEELKNTLQKTPSWLSSILYFLSRRFREAEKKHLQNNIIRALPSLLFLIYRSSEKKTLAIDSLAKSIHILNGLNFKDSLHLLKALESFDLFKIRANSIQNWNPKVIQFLYEALHYRATQKKIPSTILSLTDQLILDAFVQTSKTKSFAYQDQTAINTFNFLETESKFLRGLRLSLKSFDDLFNKKILTRVSNSESDFIHGDLDLILDLLELNRIYPLLDKKLVERL
ncbi:MAG TPA: cyclic nucleotide-binding domain-containing protein [Fibrobacter sp.]|nr:cyclic nucleotide-binding domain-containing protein [Fibrobacter sp.]